MVKRESTTRETEYGYFIRQKVRHGKKRRQKTTRLPKNPEKVTLAKLGDLEFYILPKAFPDKVFIGLYPLSTYVEEHQINDFFRIYNQIRWYFNEGWQREENTTKRANLTRQRIERAYNAGISKLKKPNTTDRDWL